MFPYDTSHIVNDSRCVNCKLADLMLMIQEAFESSNFDHVAELDAGVRRPAQAVKVAEDRIP